MSAQELLENAVTEIENLKHQEIFLVKDLFKGYIWNRQDKSDRLMLGTLFLNFAKQNADKIGILSKTSSNQQRYQKL